ncbi:MAG: methylenetetrahydrofolate reductase [Dehalococcoidales bacterium]|nr:methylenetetrahydrofolate reductase [Dehalococcoidales bacterium]
MRPDSRLAAKVAGKDFIMTAEYLPLTGTGITAISGALSGSLTAVNVTDNHYGIALSSLAASVLLLRAGIEPVLQVVTRDRNRIALQSDLLGAAALGMKNVLCLSGYHQTLIGSPESANVFDIDSIQLIATIKKMNSGTLLDGTKVKGDFAMLVGAAANPFLKPMELNMIRLAKKVAAGADFIQTQAIFDVAAFAQWLEAANKEDLTGKTAILAGVLPLTSAAQAEKLREKHTDFIIPDKIIGQIKASGDDVAQKKEGLAICVEIIQQLKSMPGLRGIHLLSGGNESAVPELTAVIAAQ